MVIYPCSIELIRTQGEWLAYYHCIYEMKMPFATHEQIGYWFILSKMARHHGKILTICHSMVLSFFSIAKGFDVKVFFKSKQVAMQIRIVLSTELIICFPFRALRHLCEIMSM